MSDVISSILSPLGMPGTQTVGGTHSCSGGDIPASSLVIRALQYTVNTTNMFNAAVQDDATAFSRSDYCHYGRSRFQLRGDFIEPVEPPWLRACNFCTCHTEVTVIHSGQSQLIL